MNINNYRNFIKIVEVGTISGAAKQLLIAQPSLSKQVKMMEEELHTKLLQRKSRNVELTSAGKIFYEKAKQICSLEDMLQDEIRSSIFGNRGILRVGFTPSYPDLYCEELFENFSILFPNITYEIYEASSDQVLSLIKNNTIEVGIVRTPTYIHPIFKTFEAVEEQLMAVFHKDNPWFSPDLETIPIKSLENIPLSTSRGFEEKVLALFHDAEITPTFFSVSSSRPTTIMWAKYKKAVGLVTTNSYKILETDVLRCRPLSGGDISTKRSFAILKTHNLSSVAKTFLNFATEETYF